MDRMIRTLIDDFLTSQEIPSQTPSTEFEQFSNYCLIANEVTSGFDLEETMTGEGDDLGIDGISFVLNGKIVNSTDEIDFLLEQNITLEATIFFIQAKTSKRFDSGEILKFGMGVSDFVSESPKLKMNESIENFRILFSYIIKKSPKLRENPKCKMFYVTNGNWTGDQNIVGTKLTIISNLENTNLFSEIQFDFLGVKEISKIYRMSKLTTSTTFSFSNRVTLPEVDTIEQSYFGILPLKEFKKILMDENNNMLSIFNDNVGDYQGDRNNVNSNMYDTLQSPTNELFMLLNNGVTIVASNLKPSGNKFDLPPKS